MKYIIRFLFGGYRLKVFCNNPSAISGLLMHKFAGLIYGVKVYDGYFVVLCFSLTKKRIIDELHKKGFEVIEDSAFGLVKRYRQIKSRPGIAVGVILSAIVIYLQTIPVWEIRVSGNKSIDEREIIESLSSVGFSVGTPKNNERLSDYANHLIMIDHRLSRASINLSGNVAFVEVGERTEKSMSDIPFSMTGLYASRDGIVELPLVQKGESVVRKGDTVYNGQLLVSPVIHGDNNVEYIVGAEGKVLAKTESIFLTAVRLEKCIATRTDNVKTCRMFSFLGESFSFDFPIPDFKNAFCKRSKERLNIFNQYELPVDIVNTKEFEYGITDIKLPADEARQSAYSIIYERISEEKESAEILSFDFTETCSEDYFLLKCKVECIENIATPLFE